MKHSLFRSSSGTNYIVPFIIVTSCFALWGFANDITNPMVKAFSKIFRMTVTEGTLVQVAFYGGYFAMAVPAALFIKRFSYKSGILTGLALYATGALAFIPARMTGSYYPFLCAYFVLTCGLSFLETSANPYILSMGDEKTSTRRLNLAQAFNPVGSLLGMFVAMNFIQARLHPMSSAERNSLDDETFNVIKDSDLSILVTPYAWIGVFILFVFLVMLSCIMPRGERELEGKTGEHLSTRDALRRLYSNKKYREGVVAQFFYVGLQITGWTFIIQYGTGIFTREGLTEKSAEILSQKYNIVAMVLFCASRFVCTFLLKYIHPSKLLMSLATSGGILMLGVIGFESRIGMYCLVGVSACMSLMFPTIYGIALGGLGEEVKLGSAGLIMAILGGSLLPPLQALIIDAGINSGHSTVNLSFIVPLISFIVIIMYGKRTLKLYENEQ